MKCPDLKGNSTSKKIIQMMCAIPTRMRAYQVGPSLEFKELTNIYVQFALGSFQLHPPSCNT